MPKLRKCHVEVLNDLVNFGTSFALSNSLISDIYHAHEQDQANYTSLRKHNIFDHTIALLRHNDVESFVQNIWASKIEGLTDKAVALLNIIRYTWISFHPTLRMVLSWYKTMRGLIFIESVIKSFLAVSKIVDFVECKWCETQFTSGKYLDYRKSDYTTNSVKYNDALDYFKLFNNMEVIIVEASSGKIQESTVHTIEDCLKLLEAILNKNSSIATFKKLKVFGLKSILNQVALSKLYFNNVTRWNSVEKRIAHTSIFLG
ncbi:uncharacterized protein EV154DRAFT_537917 [Mucor mucedo]|uniref:uncharacterized protein n=1 Tax=Mucor mucedo TaxID=29922 RepID=UPI002220792B|nr:uncharacterized protein EV154DRAFT_537917 [Mucor mucedo]KAI7891693.1 hypothetical protein EV154DRAFT_537917 [Mucor mucedo]